MALVEKRIGIAVCWLWKGNGFVARQLNTDFDIQIMKSYRGKSSVSCWRHMSSIHSSSVSDTASGSYRGLQCT